ncbi:MAG: ABC transporter substrate-binding protein [Nitrosomonas sp.]|nr:ABC transporter substrate-binding protein [Nitrosomonas sp.]
MIRHLLRHAGFLSTMLTVTALSASSVMDEVQLGRALYDGNVLFSQAPQVTGVPLPLSNAHCSACHGPHGAGQTEGGIAAPPVQWHALMDTRSGLPGYDSSERVLSAIEKGKARIYYKSLTEGMPRFELTSAERKALIAYLRVIGTEAAPVRGVTTDTIILGTALPLTGMQATAGNSILRAMQQQIAEINAVGGIFGRSLLLIPVDAATNGLDAAILDLIHSHNVFALVGSWLTDPSNALIDALTASNTPSVAAVGMTIPNQQHRLTTYLLPSLQQQIESALSILQKKCNSNLDSEIWYQDEKNLPAITAISKFYGDDSVAGKLALRAIHVLQVDQQLKETIDSRLADKLILLLPSDDIERIRFQLEASQLCVATLASISGSSYHADHAAQVVISPVPQDMLLAMDLWTALGNAAIGLIAEAMARAGRILDQDRLITVLDNPQEFEPIPGLSIRFTPKARHALTEGFTWH